VVDIRQYILSKFPGESPNAGGKIHTYCPFHDDKHPSFSINLDKDGVFICGASRCGVSGGFPLFFKMMEGITSWREVFKILKEPRVSKDFKLDLGVEEKLTDEKVDQIDQFPIEPFVEVIRSSDSISYLKDRGLKDEICDIFGIMYGRDGNFSGINIKNSLVVPIFDSKGEYKTFQVRKLGVAKKLRWEFTVNSLAKKYLYAGWLVSQSDKYLWIVEGISDVWNLKQHEIQAVAIFSSAASHYQFNEINRLCSEFDLIPVVCLDADVSSLDLMKVDFGKDIQKELIAYGLDCKIVHLDEGEDPGNLTCERVEFLRRECYREVTV